MKKILLILLSFTLFISCKKDNIECIKGEPQYDTLCTEEYDPVYAPDGTMYSNMCEAIKNGWDKKCLTKN